MQRGTGGEDGGSPPRSGPRSGSENLRFAADSPRRATPPAWEGRLLPAPTPSGSDSPPPLRVTRDLYPPERVHERVVERVRVKKIVSPRRYCQGVFRPRPRPPPYNPRGFYYYFRSLVLSFPLACLSTLRVGFFNKREDVLSMR